MSDDNVYSVKADRPKTMADRIFDHQLADPDMELFEKVCEILGAPCGDSDCIKDGYVFPCKDTHCDYYDGSVEIVRAADRTPMTKAEADKVFELGFDRIFESVGDVGYYWVKGAVQSQSCRPHTGDAKSKEATIKARLEEKDKRIAELEMENKELNALFDLQQTRMRLATLAWRAAHPGNDLVSPDLGTLLDWLIERGNR